MQSTSTDHYKSLIVCKETNFTLLAYKQAFVQIHLLYLKFLFRVVYYNIKHDFLKDSLKSMAVWQKIQQFPREWTAEISISWQIYSKGKSGRLGETDTFT